MFCITLVSHVTVEEFCLLFFAELFQQSSCKVLTHHVNWVEVWTLKHLYSFPFIFFIFKQFSCRVAGVLWIRTQFGPRFSSWTDGLINGLRILWYADKFVANLMTASFPSPVDAMC